MSETNVPQSLKTDLSECKTADSTPSWAILIPLAKYKGLRNLVPVPRRHQARQGVRQMRKEFVQNGGSPKALRVSEL